MNYKIIYRTVGGIVFLISLVVLFSTAQPSVSFWDCGEFTAAAYSLQVPHPPGTPLFTIMGRVFSMLPIAANIASRVNSLSVLTSAFSVLFLYLIAVKLIESYTSQKPKNLLDALGIYLAAATGALSFAFSDTFWFNGVEAEVYAASTFLFSAITYLMVLWNEKSDNKDNEKYILMIAYLIGLSTGVHLMSVLTIVAVVMMVLFKKYVTDEGALKKSGYIFLFHATIVLIAAFALWSSQTGTTPPSPEEYHAFDFKFKLIMVAISAVIMGFMWKKVFNKNSIYIPFIIGGIALFVTYPGIVKILPGIITEISGDSAVAAVIMFAIVLAGLGYAVFYSVKKNKATLHLAAMSLILLLLGFTTYAMIIIRANQDPPMNENQPREFSEMISYLNREQYGDFPIFKRRFSNDVQHRGIYTNYSSDLDFFWRYQMNHMMTRYWMWNYAGREGWNQDADVNIAPFNSAGKSIGKIFNITFSGSAKDSLFALPFLLGILGIIYHFKKDWKIAAVFMVLFIFMGYLTAFYQNQQQPQPRERDYFYVGAFFVFSIWIAIGVRWFVDIVQTKIKNVNLKNAAVTAVLAVTFILIPLRMLQANYYTHDRSQNWFPWDFSYNMLQSCAPNAILFTNGDNDTFPLWYMQDVEGIRRDVKIVNLSLLNTPWYIEQLKNNDPYHVGTVAINLSDTQIKNIAPMAWTSREITIPFPQIKSFAERKDFISKFSVEDTNILNSGGITFNMNSTLNYGSVTGLRVQDILVKEIVENNIWKRPIYFSLTTADDGKIGLTDYLRLEGLAFRIVPEKNERTYESINEPVMRKMLLQENTGISKTYKPNFILRGLNNPNIFYDETHSRMIQYYRNAYMNLAVFYLNKNMNAVAVGVLDKLMNTIPINTVKIDPPILFEISNIYFNAGAIGKYKKMAIELEKDAIKRMRENPSDVQSRYNPYRILLAVYENLKDYKKLAGLWKKISIMYPNDPNVKAYLLKYENLANMQDSLSGK